MKQRRKERSAVSVLKLVGGVELREGDSNVDRHLSGVVGVERGHQRVDRGPHSLRARIGFVVDALAITSTRSQNILQDFTDVFDSAGDY